MTYEAAGIRYVAFSVATLLARQMLVVIVFSVETRSQSLEVIEDNDDGAHLDVASVAAAVSSKQ